MKELIHFLKEHHVMCLATQGKHGPHAAPVFYALGENPLAFIFLSDPQTEHMQEIEKDSRVSVGIYLETKEIGLVQGAQLWGKAKILEDAHSFAPVYFKTFPHARLYASIHPSYRFCLVQVKKARLIDNRFGIGKKKEWNLEDSNT